MSKLTHLIKNLQVISETGVVQTAQQRLALVEAIEQLNQFSDEDVDLYNKVAQLEAERDELAKYIAELDNPDDDDDDVLHPEHDDFDDDDDDDDDDLD